MTEPTIPHTYCGTPVHAAVIPGQWLLEKKAGGSDLAATVAEELAGRQSRRSLWAAWTRSVPAWKSKCRFVRCLVPVAKARVVDEHTTEMKVCEYNQFIFPGEERDALFSSADDDDTTVVFVLIEDRSLKHGFLCSVLALGNRGELQWSGIPGINAVKTNCLEMNRVDPSFSPPDSRLLSQNAALQPLLPPPGQTETTAGQLADFVRDLVSFCIRWHCCSNSRDEQRVEQAESILAEHIYGTTVRFMRKENARCVLFASPLLHAALSVVTRLSRSNRLRAFVGRQVVSALEYICVFELAQLDPRQQLLVARRFFGTLASSLNSVAHGRPDTAPLDLAIDGDSELHYRAFHMCPEIDNLLLPTTEQMWDADSGVRISAGRVYLRPLTAVTMMPLALQRFLGQLRPLRGAALHRLERELLEAGFDPQLTQYDEHLPFSGDLYADDRPCDLDDPVKNTPDFPLRLHAFNAAAVNGLSRTMDELRSGEHGHRHYAVPTPDGEYDVGESALHLLMHRETESRYRMEQSDGDEQQFSRTMSTSSLRKSSMVIKNGSSNEADYLADPDGTVARDHKMREWMLQFNKDQRERRDKQRHRQVLHSELSNAGFVDEDDDDDDDDDGSEFRLDKSAASATSTERDDNSLCSSDSLTGTAPGPITDIEDVVENIYHNGGMPPCVLPMAQANIVEGAHPVDKARHVYYPFLRSLRLPAVSSPQLLAHMMRNVRTSKISELWTYFVRHTPALCRKNWQASKTWHMRNGMSEPDAGRRARCSPSCSSKQKKGACPFANLTTAADLTALRGKLVKMGLPLTSVEAVMQKAQRATIPQQTCAQFFVETRPSFGAATLAERAPPFPPRQQVRIRHPVHYTYLAAAYMEASLREPRSYESSSSEKAQ